MLWLYLLPMLWFFGLVYVCEYVIYYVILSECSWPVIYNDVENGIGKAVLNNEVLKVAFIADIHLLGPRKGHWFDKLRREWQMYRSFQTILELYEPEVIFILGDIFDEGSFSSDEVYLAYVKRFSYLFYTGNRTKLYVVAGNHDIGFHYAMHPHLENRFSESLKAPSVHLVTEKDNHFVLINSMALEKDGCRICSNTENHISYISSKFRCTNGTGRCYRGMKLNSYSRPIILQHFPLYRVNDEHCNEFDEAPWDLKQKKFKEKWDCLSKESTAFLLHKLYPRAVFSGHTHHGCRTVHWNHIHEYSIPSFNWRNKPNPSFTMAVFSPNQYAVNKCFLPHEYMVIGIYAIGITSMVVYLLYVPRFYYIKPTFKKKLV